MNTTRQKSAPIGQLPPMSNLLAFESVARNQSLSRAASELGITKSALTHSIALLEHRLKLRLVYRYSPLVILTPVGHSYFAASQAFARRLRDDHYLKSTTATTQIRVSSSRGLARLWLGPRMNGFHAAHPRIELIVSAVDRLESVLGDGVDIGLRYGGPSLPDMMSIPMWEDRLVVVGNPQLARKARFMTMAEVISTLPLVQHPSMEWTTWASGLIPASLKARPRINTVDLQFGLECAAHGVGLAIVPRRLAQAHLQSGRVELITSHSIPAKPYHAVVSEEQSRREPMRLFLDWIQRQVTADAAALAD
jgi:DNA-binding transcriptional LysR family regulator